MAKLHIEDMEFELADNTSLQQVCEDWGIPFGCTEGICGTCRIEVTEGEDNLTELTQEEQDMNMNTKERLACQCKIKGGIVKVRPW
jgi:ferredoxin